MGTSNKVEKKDELNIDIKVFNKKAVGLVFVNNKDCDECFDVLQKKIA